AALALWLAGTAAGALTYTGAANQFAGGFNPKNAPNGGFGGGSCTATHTPIVFLHGNGDEAKNWDYPAATGVPSVYREFRNAGYNDCELFGLNYLSASERSAPQLNYHQSSKAAMVRDFINAVKSYTGKSQVDVIAHSMGVTVGIHGIEYGGLWGSVRKFIGISGGLRGLASCYWAGYANPAIITCGSQNVFDSNIFGFFPNTAPGYNPKLGSGGYRDIPSGKATIFYTLRAGYNDQIACSTLSFYNGCGDTALFDSYSNVRSQLNVGRGSTAAQIDYNFSDWSIYNLSGGDADGVGHFRAKNNTGVIQRNMITGNCTGTACCSGYGYSCQ
ncbi:MAG TPA: lipase, partial [Thermoanaerobaculia bacterium]|nr:lipase [Thermoanaerobaculia bacterium]